MGLTNVWAAMCGSWDMAGIQRDVDALESFGLMLFDVNFYYKGILVVFNQAVFLHFP